MSSSNEKSEIEAALENLLNAVDNSMSKSKEEHEKLVAQARADLEPVIEKFKSEVREAIKGKPYRVTHVGISLGVKSVQNLE